jgi:para-nitrobenzyl esterase
MRPALPPLALSLALLLPFGACGGDDDDDDTPAIDASADGAGPDASVDLDAATAPTVTIDDGQLAGSIEGGTRRFLGIPFARPPVGDLRWRAPEPNEPWDGVRDATEFSDACAQLQSLQAAASESEDCLYLNVWPPSPAPEGPLPVMVWFHGGGNVSGSTADQVPLGVGGLFYDGQALAERYGVVVVTTNYRLGALGFFHHPELDAEGSPGGNQALLDQRLALEWVRDNVGAFDGDPENVTIFGESAGAVDVCLHMVAPDSAGLFDAVIGQSSGCTTYVPTSLDVEEGVAAFTEEVGCADARDPLACLRALPVATLLTEAPIDGGSEEPLPGGSFYQGGEARWRFNPIVDGVIVPAQPRDLFAAGEVAEVPLILGSNTDEGTLFHVGEMPVETEEELVAALERRFGEDAAEQIAEAYPVADFASPQAALERVTGDAAIVCATHDTARRAADAGLPVWAYNFDYPIPIPGLEFLGATHGAEIAFVFDTVDEVAQDTVGEAMRSRWTRFAATGTPNDPTAADWPAFTPDDDQRINFAVETDVVTDFRADVCALWRSIYDAQFP